MGNHTDPDILRTLYWDEGLSIEEIADKFGVVDETIRYQMVKHDIPRRKRGRPTKHE